MQPNQSNSLLSQAHQQVKARLQNGAIAIDATLGNGHDTLFLARHVAPNGMVYGFDIQEAAIVATRAKLRYAQLLEQVRLVLNCHAHLAEHIPAQHHGQIAVIMFNLGYLPGTDKQVITHSESTLVALNVALD
ncbi:MAG: class I SAM-dependent methyltransferase [Methylococcaceae bacterium]